VKIHPKAFYYASISKYYLTIVSEVKRKMPIVTARTSVRRGRVPILMLQVARLLRKCDGWDNGITINDVAKALYGNDDFHSKAKARLQIGCVRRALNVDIFSIKPVGESERRYCYLITESEYNRAIENFEKHIQGMKETEEKMKKAKEAIEAKRKLKAVREEQESTER
jgi:hypothetical protein